MTTFRIGMCFGMAAALSLAMVGCGNDGDNSEGGAGTESSMSWDQVRLTAKKWMVLTKYSNELNEDAVLNIGDDLAFEIEADATHGHLLHT